MYLYIKFIKNIKQREMANFIEVLTLSETSHEKAFRAAIEKLISGRSTGHLGSSLICNRKDTIHKYLCDLAEKVSKLKKYSFIQLIIKTSIVYTMSTFVLLAFIYFYLEPGQKIAGFDMAVYFLASAAVSLLVVLFQHNWDDCLKEAYLRRKEFAPKVIQLLRQDRVSAEQAIEIISDKLKQAENPTSKMIKEATLEIYNPPGFRGVLNSYSEEALQNFWNGFSDSYRNKLQRDKKALEEFVQCLQNEIEFLERVS